MEVSSDKVLEELFKFQLTKLKLDFEQATATVSQTVRTAAFGLAALVLPLITVAPNNLSFIVKHHPYLVEAAAALGVFAVILDIAQNLFAARMTRETFDEIFARLKSENLKLTSPADFMPLPENKMARKGWKSCYYLKIVVTALGLIILVALILIDAQTNISPAPSASFGQSGQIPHP